MNYVYFALALASLSACRSSCDSCSSVMRTYSDCTAKEEKAFDALGAKVKALENKVAALEARGYGCQSGSYQTPFVSTKGISKTFKHTFTKAFKGTPAFAFGFTHLDTYKGHNARSRAVVLSLTKAGFQLKIETWSSTILYQAIVSWIACPNA